MRGIVNACLAWLAIWAVSGCSSTPAPTAKAPGGIEVSATAQPRDADSASRAAVQWLVRHQSADGRWSSASYPEACGHSSGSVCRHLAPDTAPHPDGIGVEGYDVGVTGLAILAFLGKGHTHRDGDEVEWREAVGRAMEWLLSRQITSEDPALDGLYVDPEQAGDVWVYDHAIATLAMSELLLLSRDRPRLTTSVESAVRWCLRAQNPGHGWRYGYRTGQNDSSVTGWMVLALKTAKACSLARMVSIPKAEYAPAFAGALDWFDRVSASKDGRVGYMAPGDEGSRYAELGLDDYPYSKELPTMTAVATLCRLLCGRGRTHDTVGRSIALLEGSLPRWAPRREHRLSSVNQVYWYYGSYALFQFGGSKWKRWNQAMLEALIPHQRVGGCEDGSWDPIGEWGIAGGRVYSTAIAAMTLEIYSRFERASR